MRVVVTGSGGYIGAVLVPLLRDQGHEVTGIDIGLFDGCDFGSRPPVVIPTHNVDVRDVERHHFDGCDAVVHLAALSNDPLGDLNPELTLAINHRASVRVATEAKAAGVERFVFSSSCSLYGAAGDRHLDETAAFNPITPYGESKILTEQDVSVLADDRFSPTYLRNATAYGVSPRLRGDLMVNNLVGHALTSDKVLIKSDGTPWRPLVHVEDISRAFAAALTADRDRIHDQAFNVGATAENYQVRDVAAMVEAAVDGSTIEYAPGAAPDARDYRVDFAKVGRLLPEFEPRWTVADGIDQLIGAYREADLKASALEGEQYLRIKRVRALMDDGTLDNDLRAVGVSA
jgi:nucleoside-diphosphate-sugar epimerase